MKWVSVEGQRGVYNFDQADAEVKFAQQQHQLVRGHNLVWYQQLPGWLTGGTFTNAQLADILQAAYLALRWATSRGKIWQWDVVNEPFNEDGTLRPTMWLNALGPDYIADALRWAHQADSHAKLFLNDYNIEGIGPKSDAMYALVKSLQAQGVPIDGVGFETHLDLQDGLPPMIQENFQRFGALGLDVAITEMDVRMPLPATSDQLAAQASVYSSVDAGLHRGCGGASTSRSGNIPTNIPGCRVLDGEGAADLYDDNLAPKPAYTALIKALEHPVSWRFHHG